jgi:hypothetical protein
VNTWGKKWGGVEHVGTQESRKLAFLACKNGGLPDF